MIDDFDKAHISRALKTALESTRSELAKEKSRILEKLMKDYGDKFHTEGISEYMRRRDELDEIFNDHVEREWRDDRKEEE